MLLKKNKLKREEIELLKQKKQTVLQSKSFGVIFQRSQFSKFCLIISNKVVKKAVLRNKYRRLFYQAVKEVLIREKGYFLFLAKKAIVFNTKEEFKKELTVLKNNLV